MRWRTETKDSAKLQLARSGRAAVTPAVQSQAVPAADPGFFENMFQMDLHGSGSDSQFLGDFFVFGALFHQFEDLLLARGEFAAGIAIGMGGVAEYAVFHPAAAGGDGSQTRQHGGESGGFPENPAGASLQESKSFSLGEGHSPN